MKKILGITMFIMLSALLSNCANKGCCGTYVPPDCCGTNSFTGNWY